MADDAALRQMASQAKIVQRAVSTESATARCGGGLVPTGSSYKPLDCGISVRCGDNDKSC